MACRRSQTGYKSEQPADLLRYWALLSGGRGMPIGRTESYSVKGGGSGRLVELWTGAERLGYLAVDTNLQPGNYVDFGSETYVVLERRHRYQFRSGRYRLGQVVLQVQLLRGIEERSWTDQGWVLGNATCRFSAQSPLVRCAVNPAGPCKGCSAYDVV